MLSPCIETAGSYYVQAQTAVGLDADSIAPMCHPPQTLLLVCTPSQAWERVREGSEGSSVPARRAATGGRQTFWLAIPADRPRPPASCTSPTQHHGSFTTAQPSPAQPTFRGMVRYRWVEGGLGGGGIWGKASNAHSNQRKKRGHTADSGTPSVVVLRGRQRRETSRAGLPACT